MGKIVTIYLTDEEAIDLKNFCNENQCTQYSALKTAVKDLLFKPIKMIDERPLINSGGVIPDKLSVENKKPEEVLNKNIETDHDTDPLNILLRKLKAETPK